MSVQDVRLRGGRRGAFRMASGVADFGDQDWQRSQEIVGKGYHPQARQQPQPKISYWKSAFRLVIPIFLLLVLDAACVEYADSPASWLGALTGAGQPLSASLVILPITFFVIHLTNRRYGAAPASAQIAVASAIALIALPWQQSLLPGTASLAGLDGRVVTAFAAALVLAQLSSVFVFDRMRGPAWWQAPLLASLFGGAVFCLVAYPLAYAGVADGWSQPMVTNLEVMAVAAILFLIPYWMLRRLVPPLPGFGGY